VGSVFLSVVSTDPATLLGLGTWARIGAGKFLVGQDDADADFDTAEATGGEKTHTLTSNEMPAHSHVQQTLGTTSGGTAGLTRDASMSGSTVQVGVSTAATGGGAAHNNLPPYLVVYIWKRTA
jgi:microcystin-dependent protein